MLSIAWQYLTGRCVATEFTDRQAAEWPPHPDRVFQALVSAWGERGESPQERDALVWLEQQGPPCLSVPEEPVDRPEPVKVFVPVNDIESPNRKEYGDPLIGLIPAHRPKKERFFPAVVVGDAVCALVWLEADVSLYRSALTNLCAAV